MERNVKINEINVQEKYGEDTILEKNVFLEKNHFHENGLSSDEALVLLEQNGFNELKQAKEKQWYHYFFESLFSPFNIILLGITLVLFYTDVILPDIPNYANIIVIAILVTASTLLEFIEEYRSNQAANKLRSLVATTAHILRDGKEVKIPLKETVVGDVVLLSAGDMIPADLRIIESKDLYVRTIFFNRRIRCSKKAFQIGNTFDY